METCYKILLMMKRKPGMSLDAFKRYYEKQHVPLCAKYAQNIDRYIRRYITPQDHPETGPAQELDFDVITELWFSNKRIFDAALKHITTQIQPEEIITDEKNLFDRGSFRIATVAEFEGLNSG